MTEDLKVLDEVVDSFVKMAKELGELVPRLEALLAKYGPAEFGKLLAKRIDEREDLPEDMRMNPMTMAQAFLMGFKDTEFKESGV